MKRRHRRVLWGVGIAAAVLVVAAGVAWWFRVPLLELVPTPPIVITEKDQGSVVHLLQGQRLEIRLPGNINASSAWRVGIPLSYLPQPGASPFTRIANPCSKGDSATSGFA